MKKIAAAIAKAVLYTVFFLAVQVVTAVVFSVFAGLFDEIRHAIFGVWEDSFFTKNLISLVTIFSAAVTWSTFNPAIRSSVAVLLLG